MEKLPTCGHSLKDDLRQIGKTIYETNFGGQAHYER